MSSEIIAQERAATAEKLADIRRQIAEDRAAIREARAKFLQDWHDHLKCIGDAIAHKVAIRTEFEKDLANYNMALGLTAEGKPRKPRTRKEAPE